MNHEINLGIVGLGKMGIAHMGILSAMDGVRVRALAEPQRMVRTGVGSVVRGATVYSDFVRMLDGEKLDAVFITAPTSLHVGIAQACVERGVDFFVEKPLGVSGRECVPLVEAARGSGVVSVVGYCKHFVETFEKAKQVLEEGALGRPLYLASSMYVSQLFARGSGWRYKKASSGGGVLNILATHLVDILLWFFGDIQAVSGSLKSEYSSEVEDFVHAYLWFESGLEGYLDSSWSVRNYRLPEIMVQVQCENGTLQVTEECLKYSIDSEDRVTTLYRQDLYRGVEIHLGSPEYSREDAHFLDCVRSRRASGLDAGYGYAVQRVNDCIYDSAAHRMVVEVSGD